MASGRINNVVIREAAQHGLGIYVVPGWVQNCQVIAASTEDSGMWSAAIASGASLGARMEDLLLVTTDCDHGLDATGTLRVGGIDMVGTEAVNGNYSVTPTTIFSRSFMAPFSVGGELAITPGTFKLPILYPSRVIGVIAAVDIAPTGSSILVDVHKNGTTIFTTQANRPAIAATTDLSGVAFPDVTKADPGEYLTVDIDQVGSTTPGETLTVVVLLENDQA